MPPEALMQLRNVTGYPLVIRKYNKLVGPGEVIDTGDLGHDMDRDGVITGFEPVEEPKQASKPKTAAKADEKDKEQAR